MPRDVLIHAGTLRSAELRQLIPAPILDAFLYGEHEGRPFAAIWPPDDALVRGVRPDIELLDPFALGLAELIEGGMNRHVAVAEVALRACRQLGVEAAAVPNGFPLLIADHLRAGGVELQADGALFEARRRSKGAAELVGVRRAAEAARAGMKTVSELLARAELDGRGGLLLDGEALTVERLRDAVRATYDAHDALGTEILIAPGAQGASGHDLGAGPIAADTPVIVDLWPQDRDSTYWADMTRTFVVGAVDPEVARWRSLCLDVHEHVRELVRPGVTGEELWAAACDVVEAAGVPTQRAPGGRAPLRDGFFHSLGHGVGLEVHEAPLLGRGGEPLVEGDLITVEPGIYREGWGGVRIEDLLLVTETGCENLTPFATELTAL